MVFKYLDHIHQWFMFIQSYERSVFCFFFYLHIRPTRNPTRNPTRAPTSNPTTAEPSPNPTPLPTTAPTTYPTSTKSPTITKLAGSCRGRCGTRGSEGRYPIGFGGYPGYVVNYYAPPPMVFNPTYYGGSYSSCAVINLYLATETPCMS